MSRLALSVTALLLLAVPGLAPAQDVMKTGAKHWSVLDENDDVRVLHFAPQAGDKTPLHSHPMTVVYFAHGGKVRITRPDGSEEVMDYPTGAAFIRGADKHADEALDAVDMILVELKHEKK